MSDQNLPEDQHNIEIHENLKRWQNKPLLQKIYLDFYKLIAVQLNTQIQGKIVELGSGIGNLKMVIPNAICTDIFSNSWIDQVENAYKLSFGNESISNIILFDVWHHLEFPGSALAEFDRVLKKKGRIILFEPAMSLAGFVVYGLFHHEPVGYFKKITWFALEKSELVNSRYYAAQANASKVFYSSKYKPLLKGWSLIHIRKFSAISYVLSGGYSKRQLYPVKLLPFLKLVDKVLDSISFIFATRLIIVLEKK